MGKLETEIKNLRLVLEETNRKLAAIDEFCGLLYEEKYGGKKPKFDLWDIESIEKESKQKRGF